MLYFLLYYFLLWLQWLWRFTLYSKAQANPRAPPPVRLLFWEPAFLLFITANNCPARPEDPRRALPPVRPSCRLAFAQQAVAAAALHVGGISMPEALRRCAHLLPPPRRAQTRTGGFVQCPVAAPLVLCGFAVSRQVRAHLCACAASSQPC